MYRNLQNRVSLFIQARRQKKKKTIKIADDLEQNQILWVLVSKFIHV